MWKLLVVLVVACFTPGRPQSLSVECDFRLSDFDEYSCHLIGVTVNDPAVDVTFGGAHVEGRSNEDVTYVEIVDSTTPFIIPQMFTVFPNLADLSIRSSGLQSVDIPETAQLSFIDFFGNNITRLESDSLKNQTGLVLCFLQYNRIQQVHENALDGLTNLLFLDFSENFITQFSPQTFSSLVEVVYISFSDNLVTRIDDELFSRNSNLGTLNMSYNRINEISPRFGDGFREHAHIIGLVLNTCIDLVFVVNSDQDWNDMMGELQTCFSNFNNGTGTDTQRITMEFTGPLTFLDEGGNVLARVNH